MSLETRAATLIADRGAVSGTTGTRKSQTAILDRVRGSLRHGAKVVAAVALASQLAACAQNPVGYGTPGGQGINGTQLLTTGIGAAAGGIIGNRMAHGGAMGTLLGIVGGGVVGNLVGRGLTAQDTQRAQYAQTQAYAAPVGQPVQWQNPQTGNYGTITPVRQGYDSTGALCREYQTTIVVGGQQQQGYGTACSRDGGRSWQIISAAEGPQNDQFASVDQVAPGYEHLADLGSGRALG